MENATTPIPQPISSPEPSNQDPVNTNTVVPPATSQTPATVSLQTPYVAQQATAQASNNYAMDRRVSAFVLDVVSWIPIFIIASQHFGTYSVSGSNINFNLTGIPLVVFMLVFTAYYVLFECLAGGTLGKLAVGVRVIDEQGNKPSFAKSFIRNALRIVDGFPYILPNLVGFIVASTSDKKQRLGDKAAHTFVAKTDKTKPAATRAWISLAVLVIAGIAVIILVPASKANTTQSTNATNTISASNSNQVGQNSTAEDVSNQFVNDIYTNNSTAAYQLTSPAYQATASQTKNANVILTASQLITAKPTEDHSSPLFNQSPNQNCYIYDAQTKQGNWFMAVNLQYVSNNWLIYNWRLAGNVQCPKQ